MSSLPDLARKLHDASVEHAINPYTDVIAKFPPTLDLNQWFMPPELLSLHGTPFFDQLSEQVRQRLSFYELVNMFSFTLHGERTQTGGLIKRLYRADLAEVTPYLHDFASEENNHMAYFGKFCLQYAGKVYPARPGSDEPVARAYAPGEEDFLFFIMLMIFEELGDPYNVKIATDPRVNPLVRDINMLHHKDEMRHLVFGREIVKTLWEKFSPEWSDQTRTALRAFLNDYFVASWWEYYNMRAYKDAGLDGDLFELRESAFEHPACREHRRKMSAGVSKFLVETGILERDPDVG